MNGREIRVGSLRAYCPVGGAKLCGTPCDLARISELAKPAARDGGDFTRIKGRIRNITSDRGCPEDVVTKIIPSVVRP